MFVSTAFLDFIHFRSSSPTIWNYNWISWTSSLSKPVAMRFLWNKAVNNKKWDIPFLWSYSGRSIAVSAALSWSFDILSRFSVWKPYSFIKIRMKSFLLRKGEKFISFNCIIKVLLFTSYHNITHHVTWNVRSSVVCLFA